jgi:hypothetical protein
MATINLEIFLFAYRITILELALVEDDYAEGRGWENIHGQEMESSGDRGTYHRASAKQA